MKLATNFCNMTVSRRIEMSPKTYCWFGCKKQKGVSMMMLKTQSWDTLTEAESNERWHGPDLSQAFGHVYCVGLRDFERSQVATFEQGPHVHKDVICGGERKPCEVLILSCLTAACFVKFSPNKNQEMSCLLPFCRGLVTCHCNAVCGSESQSLHLVLWAGGKDMKMIMWTPEWRGGALWYSLGCPFQVVWVAFCFVHMRVGMTMLWMLLC